MTDDADIQITDVQNYRSRIADLQMEDYGCEITDAGLRRAVS